jgi:hypothetical protein
MEKEQQKKADENSDLDPEIRGSPYSPSNALEEEERMDWSANLTGTKELYERPPSTLQEEGAPGGSPSGTGETPTGTNAQPNDAQKQPAVKLGLLTARLEAPVHRKGQM